MGEVWVAADAILEWDENGTGREDTVGVGVRVRRGNRA